VLKPRAKGLGLGAENDEKKEKKTFEYGEYILILEGTYKNLIGQVTENDGEK
jgi:transcription antitermination factor NusG